MLFTLSFCAQFDDRLARERTESLWICCAVFTNFLVIDSVNSSFPHTCRILSSDTTSQYDSRPCNCCGSLRKIPEAFVQAA